MKKSARLLHKCLSLFLVMMFTLSMMSVGYAAETTEDSGESVTTTQLTAEEKAEQELLAKALVNTASYLRLSVTELNLKAGETYTVRLIPTQLAKMFGWKIDEAKTQSSNKQYLSVQGVDQDNLSITFKAEKSGYRVSLGVKITNPTLTEMAEKNPALQSYVKTVQNKTLTCKVATNNTATKVVAGVGITAPAPAVPSGGGGYYPSNPGNPGGGGNIPVIPTPPCIEHVDADNDGKCDKCGQDMPACEHEYVNGVCTKCGAKDPNYKPGTEDPDNPKPPVTCDHVDADHNGVCDKCGQPFGTASEHVDANADDLCDKCGADMSGTHDCANALHIYNGNGVCIYCGSQKPIDPCDEHTYNANGVCTVCGAVRDAAPICENPEDHTYNANHVCTKCGTQEPLTDCGDGNHAYNVNGVCSVCGAVSEEAPDQTACSHDYADGDICVKCGIQKPVEDCGDGHHSYDTSSDDPVCTVCGKPNPSGSVTDCEDAGEDHTYNTAGICTKCGAQKPIDACAEGEHTYGPNGICTKCGAYTSERPECSGDVEHDYDGGDVCINCGHQKPIDACADGEHTYGPNGVCTKCGAYTNTRTECEDGMHDYDGGDVCINCGHQKPVEPEEHEHTYNAAGICTVCGAKQPVDAAVDTTVTTETDKDGKTTTTAAVDKAAVDKAIESKKDGAALNLTIDMVDVEAEDVNATELSLSAEAVKALQDAAGGDAVSVTVKTSTGTVVLPLEALTKDLDPDNDQDVTLAVNDVDKASLPTEDANGDTVDLENGVFVDVTIKVGADAKEVEHLSENIQITVAAPKADDGSAVESVKVYFVKEDPNTPGTNVLEPVGDPDQTYEVDADGNVAFEVNHLTTFVVVDAGTSGDEPTDPDEPKYPVDPKDCTVDHSTIPEGEKCEQCGTAGTKKPTVDPTPEYPVDPADCTVDHSTIPEGEKCEQCGTSGTKKPTVDPEPKHDCAKDGHEYVNGVCKWCEEKDPDYEEPAPKHDCAKDGHEYEGGTCKWCGEKENATNPEEPKPEEHDCAADGHEYEGGTCKWCGEKEPDPTDPPANPPQVDEGDQNDPFDEDSGANV